jgi:hypothetical protein
MSSPASTTTKAEREELQRLVRQREKVLKSAAKDEVWRKAEELAEQEVSKAQARVAARRVELGIPKRFAPELRLSWYSRGENGMKSRRDELRRVAQTKIGSIEAKAVVAIELSSVNAQTEITAAGLTSAAPVRSWSACHRSKA